MTKLKIPNDMFEQMLEQAKTEAPVEACGILAGKNGRIEKLYKMTNTDQSSAHFMMEPEEQFKVVKHIRAAGLEMSAIYHSHPETPARPSQEDIKMALTPDVIYVILSLKDKNIPDVKGYFINDSEIAEVTVKIVESKTGGIL